MYEMCFSKAATRNHVYKKKILMKGKIRHLFYSEKQFALHFQNTARLLE